MIVGLIALTIIWGYLLRSLVEGAKCIDNGWTVVTSVIGLIGLGIVIVRMAMEISP
jgi:hypothetical protein